MSGHAQEGAQENSPIVVVITGPSGVGKDTVIRHLQSMGRPWHFVYTATTRKPRPGERHGVNHLFVEQDEFQEMIDRGDLLEYAEVYGKWYGVPRSQVKNALGIMTGIDEGLGGLLQHRGFPHPSRPGQQNGPAQSFIVKIAAAGVKGQTVKFRHKKGLCAPPRVKSVQDIDDFRAV